MEDYKVIQSGEHTVKVRNYITGADKEAVRAIIATATTITIENDKEKMSVDAGIQSKVDIVLISRFVEEVDGSTEDVVNKLQALRIDDYEKILAELNEMTKRIGLDSSKKRVNQAVFNASERR